MPGSSTGRGRSRTVRPIRPPGHGRSGPQVTADQAPRSRPIRPPVTADQAPGHGRPGPQVTADRALGHGPSAALVTTQMRTVVPPVEGRPREGTVTETARRRTPALHHGGRVPVTGASVENDPDSDAHQFAAFSPPPTERPSGNAEATSWAAVNGGLPCRLALVTANGPLSAQSAWTTGWSGHRTPTVNGGDSRPLGVLYVGDDGGRTGDGFAC